MRWIFVSKNSPPHVQVFMLHNTGLVPGVKSSKIDAIGPPTLHTPRYTVSTNITSLSIPIEHSQPKNLF